MINVRISRFLFNGTFSPSSSNFPFFFFFPVCFSFRIITNSSLYEFKSRDAFDTTISAWTPPITRKANCDYFAMYDFHSIYVILSVLHRRFVSILQGRVSNMCSSIVPMLFLIEFVESSMKYAEKWRLKEKKNIYIYNTNGFFNT